MSIRIAAAVVLLVAAGSATAQESSVFDPKAKKGPGVAYRSAFEDYRPFAEQKPADWRRANDEVRDVGGHLGLAKGQGSGEAASRPQPGSPEASGGAAEKGGMHGGHHK